MSHEEWFWKATVEELSRGYIENKEADAYFCLLCHHRFERGVIFPIEGRLYDAKKAVELHIKETHQSVFDFLLNMDKKYTGLSDHQKELLHYFKKGLSDKEIVNELNGGSPSTIRNHRFKLKEKEKQAKVFLALMGLLNSDKQVKRDQDFIDFHKGAKMVDERYAITEEERKRVLSAYFKQGIEGPLDTFPSKEKRKIIVLQTIINRFETQRTYSEKQVNEVLKAIYHDFATLRRYLIEYGFMDRDKDCSNYWVRE